jgi:hypothetical protein
MDECTLNDCPSQHHAVKYQIVLFYSRLHQMQCDMLHSLAVTAVIVYKQRTTQYTQ